MLGLTLGCLSVLKVELYLESHQCTAQRYGPVAFVTLVNQSPPLFNQVVNRES